MLFYLNFPSNPVCLNLEVSKISCVYAFCMSTPGSTLRILAVPRYHFRSPCVEVGMPQLVCNPRFFLDYPSQVSAVKVPPLESPRSPPTSKSSCQTSSAPLSLEVKTSIGESWIKHYILLKFLHCQHMPHFFHKCVVVLKVLDWHKGLYWLELVLNLHVFNKKWL